MVDKIDKQLRKLSQKQRTQFANLIEQILAGKAGGFDILKLKGREDTYRVRKGNYRIIFRKVDNGEIKIIAFENRSDTTYN